MTVSSSERERVVRQWETSQKMQNPPSLRNFAKSLGQSEASVRRWVREAENHAAHLAALASEETLPKESLPEEHLPEEFLSDATLGTTLDATLLKLVPATPLSIAERQEKLASDTLEEAHRLILTIPQLPSSKAALEVANAAAKLIEKFHTLSGTPESISEVTHLGSFSNEDLDAMLDEMGYVGPKIEAYVTQEEDGASPPAEAFGKDA